MPKGIGIKFDYINIDDARTIGIIKSDAKLIAESIHRLINTSPYERPHSAYGCRIKEVLFEPTDYIAAKLGGYYISDAVDKWEKRAIIELIDVTISSSAKKINAKIYFKLRNDPTTIFSTNVTV
jgi:phage baseplate assembly protein W